MTEYQRKYLEVLRHRMINELTVESCVAYGAAVETALAEAQDVIYRAHRRRSFALRVITGMLIAYVTIGMSV